MTPRQTAYREFLSTLRWSMLRDACLERDGYRCARCRSKHILQAHHVSYPKVWADTTLEQLQTLCRRCHQIEHGISSLPPWVRTKAARKRYFKKLKKQAKDRLKENWKAQGKVW